MFIGLLILVCLWFSTCSAHFVRNKSIALVDSTVYCYFDDGSFKDANLLILPGSDITNVVSTICDHYGIVGIAFLACQNDLILTSISNLRIRSPLFRGRYLSGSISTLEQDGSDVQHSFSIPTD